MPLTKQESCNCRASPHQGYAPERCVQSQLKAMAPSSLFSMIGVPGYPQRLRIKRQDVSGHTVSRLSGTLSRREKTLAGIDPNDSEKMKAVHENIANYERELAHFQELARK